VTHTMDSPRRRRGVKLAVRRLAAFTALVAGGALATITPASAGPHPTELHHNISGAGLGLGNYSKTNWLKNAFSATGSARPLAISLNESCYNQAMELKSWIQSTHGLDYTLTFHVQKANVNQCPGYSGTGAGKYGVGVLTYGQHDWRTGQFQALRISAGFDGGE